MRNFDEDLDEIQWIPGKIYLGRSQRICGQVVARSRSRCVIRVPFDSLSRFRFSDLTGLVAVEFEGDRYLVSLIGIKHVFRGVGQWWYVEFELDL